MCHKQSESMATQICWDNSKLSGKASETQIQFPFPIMISLKYIKQTEGHLSLSASSNQTVPKECSSLEIPLKKNVVKG